MASTKQSPPQRTITVALDMSKAFDTVNLHLLIQKLHNTTIPGTITKYIANYIKGRKQYTTFNGHTSKLRNIKTGVPQGGVLSPTLFNIYTADIPQPPPGTKLVTYADDITIMSSHRHPQTAQNQVQPYLDQIHDWTTNNQLTLNPNKTMTTLFTPDPAEYSLTLDLKIDNTTLPTVRNPKILGLTFDPKLTYGQHIQTCTQNAKQSLKVIKALTTTTWGKSKETLLCTYKTITRPQLEYASTVWSPITSQTQTSKLQTIQNTALRTITGCTRDTNTQHLHEETKTLPVDTHLKLHASQYRQKTQDPNHPLHHLTNLPRNPRNKKQTIFQNDNYTTNLDTDPQLTTEHTIKQNMKTIHTRITEQHLLNRLPNKVLADHAPTINTSEESLTKHKRRTLAQLRTNKSPFLQSYLHKIDPQTNPSPHCPLCLAAAHDTAHLFNCPRVNTTLTPSDLWRNPVEVASLLDRWAELLGRPLRAP